MEDTEKADMVIVGSGFHGLSMARTWLQLNPTSNLIILDSGTSVGGVWATDRLYPGLRTNSVTGHFEFSDMPMSLDKYGVKEGCHIAGDVVRRYLEDYAEKFDLKRLVRFGCMVETAEDRGEEGWLLTVLTEGRREQGQERQKSTENSTSSKDESARKEMETTQTSRLHAAKLVVATGLTSTPVLPSLPGSSTFNAPIFHSRDFGAHARLHPLCSPISPQATKTTQTIAVISGNKSAFDVAHAYATASPSTTVHVLIRSSGHGPCWMAPARVTPLQVLAEDLITTRLVTLLNPCIWGPADGYGALRAAIHGSRAGRAVVDWFQKKVVQAGVEKVCGDYAGSADEAKLRPWHDIFWLGTGRGLLNYEVKQADGSDGLFALVRAGRIRIHVADVEHLSPRAVHLSDGATLDDVDALVCCTGWRHAPSLRFVDPHGRDIAADLGLPHGGRPAKQDELHAPLVARADAEILATLPRLAAQPPPSRPPNARGEPPTVQQMRARGMADAYALHRFVVPPGRIARGTRTLAFAGAIRTASTAVVAQMQALWISAFFAHALPHLESAAATSAGTATVNGSANGASLSSNGGLAVPGRGANGHPVSTPEIEKGAGDFLQQQQGDEGGEQEAQKEVEARVAYESILHARYGMWRYPHGFGAVMPDFFFDALPLFDLMLGELGLPRWRKRGWARELLESYGPHDYEGMVEEWAERQEEKKRSSEAVVVDTRREKAMMRAWSGTAVVSGTVLLVWVFASLYTRGV